MTDGAVLAETLARHAEHAGPAPTRESELMARLPSAHQDLLRELNGFSIRGGALRVFGVRAEPWLDLRQWNSHGLWRYAWGKPLDGWLMIAQNAFGSQYAYRIEDPDREVSGPVYYLDPIELTGEPFFDDVDAFFDECVGRMAERVFDPELKEAVERYGPLDPSELLVFSPAEAIGGARVLDNVRKLPAVTAMTFAGDIYRQIDQHPDKDPVEERPYQDDKGRDRLELLYDE